MKGVLREKQQPVKAVYEKNKIQNECKYRRSPDKRRHLSMMLKDVQLTSARHEIPETHIHLISVHMQSRPDQDEEHVIVTVSH